MDKLQMLLVNAWGVMVSLSFWLLVGLAVAGALRIWIPNDFVKKHLGSDKGILSVFKAVLFGVPMPLCSCGVIPAALGIKKQGAGDGAAIGFLISTPQTGVDSIMVSASLLGFPLALFKVFSAFLIGAIGGIWAYFTDSERDGASADTGDGDNSGHAGGGGMAAVRGMFEFAIDDLLAGIWKWLLVGVLASAAITTWLPENFFRDYLPGSDLAAMFIVLLVSLPMYVCATASVPIAASLVYAGMPPGAALVFLMAGPASNIATIGAVNKTFGTKALLVYLCSIIGGSIFCGMLFQWVLPGNMMPPPLSAVAKNGHDTTEIAAALILTALMLRLAFREFRGKLNAGKAEKTALEPDMETASIRVEGMTCQGCAGKIQSVLSALPGVVYAQVDLETGIATVTGVALDLESLRSTIRVAGFKTPD